MIRLLVHQLPDQRFYQRFYQGLVVVVFLDSARHMIVILENELQLLYPFFLLIFKVDVIKPDEEKLGAFLHIKGMTVLRHYQKQLTRTIRQLVFVNTLYAIAFHNIHQFKKIMLMRIYRALRAFPVFNLKRLI
jgi:hypothetical protein